MIAATHTHSSTGPIWPVDSTGYAALGGDAFDPRVFEFTAQGIAKAIVRGELLPRARQARHRGDAASPTPRATATSSRSSATRTSRRTRPAAKEASIDPVLTVIRVDELDGRPIGVWSNFAIHETSFGDENLLFSGDNAAFTERIVEEEIRTAARKRGTPARRPGNVVNVWTNSNEGDISPDGGTEKVPAEPTAPKAAQGASPRPRRASSTAATPSPARTWRA